MIVAPQDRCISLTSRKRRRCERTPTRSTYWLMAMVAALSVCRVKGFTTRQKQGTIRNRNQLANNDMVLVETKPIQPRSRRRNHQANSNPVVDEDFLESFGNQFVALTEPKLKQPEILRGLTSVVSRPRSPQATTPPPDSSSPAPKKESTKPHRKASTRKDPASPGRRTPDFTSLVSNRKRTTLKMDTDGSPGPKNSLFRLGDGTDVSEYYFTPLLNREEEYSLGMKVRLMSKCYLVHEGLARQLDRLPSIEEWANACGYAEPDPSFQCINEHELRPTGYQTMFEPVNPSDFVGNGLAGDAGPGRGRGRQRKPPPVKLGMFVDDSEYQAQCHAYEKDRTLPKPKKTQKPTNRGTPRDFCDMMEQGRLARQRMMQTNMRLVVSIANKYKKSGVSLQDLVQEGSLGLHRATEKYDPTKVCTGITDTIDATEYPYCDLFPGL